MNNTVKSLLGVAIIIFLGVAAYNGLRYVDAYSKSIQPSSFRSFSITGEGKSVAVPDVATFTFSVITEGKKDIATLQKTNTEKVNKAIEFLKSNKIDAKDIKTDSYNLDPRYQYATCPTGGGVCPPPEIVGYTITQTVSVKIRDFAKIGDVLSGVIKNGANSVSQLSFTIDDPTKVQDAAREEAIAKAKVKAEMVAKAGGFSVGKLLSITEENSYPPLYEYGRGGGAMMAKAERVVPVPTIEPGSQETKITVTLTYEIE